MPPKPRSDLHPKRPVEKGRCGDMRERTGRLEPRARRRKNDQSLGGATRGPHLKPCAVVLFPPRRCDHPSPASPCRPVAGASFHARASDRPSNLPATIVSYNEPPTPQALHPLP
ncbi:unnamed protein product, partial [Iphiclides podalirius]